MKVRSAGGGGGTDISVEASALVVFIDYASDKRARCYACRLPVWKGNPVYTAIIGKNRQRVLHELCADIEIAPGKTHLTALKDAARNWRKA